MAKASVPRFDDEVVEVSPPLVLNTITLEEVAPPLLNEAVPEKEAPGHQSRDFFTPLS